MTSPRLRKCLAAALLALHLELLVVSAFLHAPVRDEPNHLAAGIWHWCSGEFDEYPVNPPLARLAAAMPLLLLRRDIDWCLTAADVSYSKFVNDAAADPTGTVSLARLGCIPFSLIGALASYAWASRLYGPRAGLFTLALWCLSPAMLGNGCLINSDVAGASLAVAAGFSFWEWLGRHSWAAALAAGATLSLAQLAKFTLVVLIPLWPLIWILSRARMAPTAPTRTCLAQLACIELLSVLIINGGYGLEGSFQRLGDYPFQSSLLTAQLPGDFAPRNRFAGTYLAGVRVPLPRNYVIGMDLQKLDFERGWRSYLRGEWQNGGWWYYYLYGLAVKEPLGTWLLGLLALGISVGSIVRRSRGRDRTGLVSAVPQSAGPADDGRVASRGWRDELAVLLPAIAVLALVSSQMRWNHHVRYALPALPFIYVWIGKVAERISFRVRPVFSSMAIGGLAWGAASSLWVYPHSLSYFNELAGGPANGHAHLLGSNIDRGQDLLFLKKWLAEHPEVPGLRLAYEGPVNPAVVGIPSDPPPLSPEAHLTDAQAAAPQDIGPLPGWYAVSVNHLHGTIIGLGDIEKRYAYFLRYKPVAMAGYSIYVYCISVDDANRVRRELGLPPVDEIAALRENSESDAFAKRPIKLDNGTATSRSH